jgi:hypothetical protein
MKKFARLPAIPLITQDPLVSVWAASDFVTCPVTTHWCGHKKPLKGNINVDGKDATFLSSSGKYDCAELIDQCLLEAVGSGVECVMLDELADAYGIFRLITGGDGESSAEREDECKYKTYDFFCFHDGTPLY